MTAQFRLLFVLKVSRSLPSRGGLPTKNIDWLNIPSTLKILSSRRSDPFLKEFPTVFAENLDKS
jgi:hypothetical protein